MSDMKRVVLFTFLLLACAANSLAQQFGPSILWQKCIGGSRDDQAYSIAKAVDGGLVVVGSSLSNDGDVTGHHGSTDSTDGWVVKLSSDGTVQWGKSIGGSGVDVLKKVVRTTDDGYICVGTTTSNDGDVAGNHGGQDVWVVKLDAYGNIQWQKCLGGSLKEVGSDIAQTADGNYILIGTTSSTDGNVSGLHPCTNCAPYTNSDAWVVKLDNNGNLLWQHCYGSSSNDNGYGIVQLASGGYVLSVDDFDGTHDYDFATAGGGNPPNGYLVKIGDTGAILKVYNPGQRTSCYGAMSMSSGRLYSITHLNNCYPMNPNNGINIYQYDTSFNNLGSYDNFAYCPGITAGSVYGYSTAPGSGTSVFLGSGNGVLAATTSDTTSTGNHGGYSDGYVGNFGAHTWGRCYGGSGQDQFQGIVAINDADFVVAGFTNSNNGDVSGNHGGFDFWVVRLSHFNTVRGTVYLDYNKNGAKDTNEPLVNNVLVQSSGAGIVSGSSTVNGIFNNIVDTGTYTTTVVSTVPFYTAVPASRSSTFSAYDIEDSFSIAMQPLPGKRDYAVSLYPMSFPRPGDSITMGLLYINEGTDTLSGRTVRLVKDHRLQYLSAVPAATSVSGDTLLWTVATLSPRDTGTITIYTKAMTPPALNMNDTLVCTAWIDTSGDLNTANNTFVLKEVVRAGFDPNGKTESNEGFVDSADLAKGKYLQYTITFQNTGNDTAFNISVVDTLSSKLDVTSFEMVGASAPYQLTTRNGNILTWTFSSIRLPDSTVNEPGSHGYIVYRIRPAAGLHQGDSILNGAGIYFDFNPVVATAQQKTRILSAASLPPAPMISGLQPDYCQSLGSQQVNVSNMPGSGSGITVKGILDGQPVTISGTGAIAIQPQTLSAGAHTLAVIFGNAVGTDTTRAGFLIDSAVTPTVRLAATPSGVSSASQQVVLTATNVSGGGTQPLYTFARDAGFSTIVQAESAVSTATIAGSMLSPGNNVFYVRMRTSNTCYKIQIGVDSVVVYDTVVPQPSAPVISGLATDYCQNAGSQQVTVTNMPAAGSGVTVTSKLDGQALTVSAAGTITLQPQALSLGAHTLAVIFTNSAGADTTTAGFQIEQAVTPVVKLAANPARLTVGAVHVELVASDVSGGGKQPLYTFASDAAFRNILQPAGLIDSVLVPASALSLGNNVFYVRMQTSDSCYTAASAIDSVVVTLISDSSGSPGLSVPTVGPNPFAGEVTIGGLQSNMTYGIDLLSTAGQEVIRMVVQGQTQAVLRAGSLQRGVYYLRIVDLNSGRVLLIMKLLSATH
jgi:uncharacterized repeat protein (TIGR01451 family)